MKIKELSKKLNVSQKTIRYYEQCGLISPLKEQKMGRNFRDYDEKTVEQLQIIVELRKLRFAIEEIQEMFERPDAIEEICRHHRNEMEKEIGVMTGICRLLDEISYEQIDSGKKLTEEIERRRKEMILDESFTDYDLSKFDEEFTDHDLYLQKQEEHREHQKLVAESYYFVNPRVKSNLSGSSPSSPR